MENKKMGVIGGMGPKATSAFFEKVIANTVSNKDQDHIDMVILNHASLPDRTHAILTKDEKPFLQLVQKDIQLLELAGVHNIAIPCNTAHYFYDKIQAMTTINVINMVHESVKEVYRRFGKKAKVGILATNGTINSGIYQKQCLEYGLQPHTPNAEVQQQVMDLIYKKVKGNLVTECDEIETIIHDLITKEGCDCIIIACTELSCLSIKEDTLNYCIDAMDVLVTETILLSDRVPKNGRERASKAYL